MHSKTMQPITGEDLAPLFPMRLIQQEISDERCVFKKNCLRLLIIQVEISVVWSLFACGK
jgi:hypothetical protein